MRRDAPRPPSPSPSDAINQAEDRPILNTPSSSAEVINHSATVEEESESPSIPRHEILGATSMAAVTSRGSSGSTGRATSDDGTTMRLPMVMGYPCAPEASRECLASLLPMHAVWVLKQVVCMRVITAVDTVPPAGRDLYPDPGPDPNSDLGSARDPGTDSTSHNVGPRSIGVTPPSCSICLRPVSCPLHDRACGHWCCEACVWARLQAEGCRLGVGCPCARGSAPAGGSGRQTSQTTPDIDGKQDGEGADECCETETLISGRGSAASWDVDAVMREEAKRRKSESRRRWERICQC